MSLLPRLSSLGRNLLHKPRMERDLGDEVRSYVEMLTDEKVRAGLSPLEARRRALIELGGVEQVKEQVREIRIGTLLETLFQDLRYGVRTLAKNPGFTAVAVLALALGIGANSAIFSVVYGVLFRPLPYSAADRLALVYMRFSPQNTEHGTMSIADYLDWKAQNRAFEDPALFSHSGWLFEITGAGDPEQVPGAVASAGFFSVLQASPLIGRVFHAGEDRPTSAPVVVLSEALWRRRFGGDPNVMGRPVKLRGTQCTIIGVMPASFRFPSDSELWVNLRINPPTRRGPFPFIGIGRLKPGITFEQAQAETNAIGRGIEQAFPKNYTRLTLPVVPLREALVGDVRLALLVVFGAVFFVLLIAVVNVANLLLARAATREREIALRLSLGAGRTRLVRQLLTESIVLALLGGLAALALANAGIDLLRVWNPGNLPRIEDVHLDARVLAFTFFIALVAGVLFGLAPALQSSRADFTTALKQGSRGGTAIALRRRTHAALVVAEIALSFMLVIGAGLLLRSFTLLENVRPGFEAPPQNVLTMRISPSASRFADERSGIALYQQLLERLRGLPGVESVAVSDSRPPDRRADYDTFQIEGQAWTEAAFPATTVALASPGYFRTLGIPVLKGRHFDDRDTLDSPGVVIISESIARRYFPNQEPVGRHLKQSGPDNKDPWLEIVGVVADVKYTGLNSKSEPAYYRPHAQSYDRNMWLLVRSAATATMAPLVRRELHAIDDEATVNDVGTLAQAMSDSVAQPRFRTALIGLFAGIALLLASIGIYGVIAYGVAQRTNEIGIRIALGASRADVLRLVTRQGAGFALAGITLGLVGALPLTRLISGLLFSVSPIDPLTFGGVSLLWIAVAMLASFIPARRATKIDPLAALRYD